MSYRNFPHPIQVQYRCCTRLRGTKGRIENSWSDEMFDFGFVHIYVFVLQKRIQEGEELCPFVPLDVLAKIDIDIDIDIDV